MKSLIALFLAGVSCVSFAGERVAARAEQSGIERYTYSTHLDIAKVVSHSDDSANICGLVPAQMTYEDHQGQRHTIEYQVMGNGCSHG